MTSIGELEPAKVRRSSRINPVHRVAPGDRLEVGQRSASEVRGRMSGRRCSNPVVITSVEYLVSMLGSGSDWVKNVEAARGDAVIRQGRRRPVHLVAVPPEQRAAVLRAYVRIA